jgi:uncharacterized integral membrane protein (TIGR00698 family)
MVHPSDQPADQTTETLVLPPDEDMDNHEGPAQRGSGGALGRRRNPRLNAIDPKLLFFVGLLVSASGIVSPPIALAAGLCFGLVFTHPLRSDSSRLAKLLLQLSVVALGFGMNLFQVLKVGRSGFLYTAVSITASLALGLSLGKLARVKRKASFLISVGTAICGGSAIAAVAPIIDSNEDEISVAMGTVFVLNSVALFVFPVIGAALHLTQNQFGLWAALAIHDTSSVVGASAKYGSQALVVGTTVKLARALWIVPVSLATALYWRSHHRNDAQGNAVKTRVRIPWFIFFFCIASVLRTYTGRLSPFYDSLAHLGKTGLTATLFLIGTGLSRETLRQVGFRPFLQGVLLWIVVASVSLFAIYHAMLLH